MSNRVETQHFSVGRMSLDNLLYFLFQSPPMCNVVLEGTRAVLDMAKCPFEFASAEFINYHLKDLSTIDAPITTLRYEEEIMIELDEKQTALLIEYASVIKQVEALLLRRDIYGLEQDEQYAKRRRLIREFYEYMFMNPIIAANKLRALSIHERPPDLQGMGKWNPQALHKHRTI